jgi:cell division protein ZapE
MNIPQNMFISPFTAENERTFKENFNRCLVISKTSIPQQRDRHNQNSHINESRLDSKQQANVSGQRYRFADTCETSTSVVLPVYGHSLFVPMSILGRRICRFKFSDLCEKSYGPSDYIELSKAYNVLFLSHVPRMGLDNRNEVSVLQH